MKSPVGTKDFCEQVVMKRVEKAEKIFDELAKLPDRHCALYLLRYQSGRMDYILRTTPSSDCNKALGRFDAALRRAYEAIIGAGLAGHQWQQACLSTRLGGVGLRATQMHADSSYYSSRAMTWARWEAIYRGFASLMDDPVNAV